MVADAQAVPRGYCWIPTVELETGMVLARPVAGGSGINSAIQLPVGTTITAATVEQLVNKGIEAVAVMREPPDPAAHALAMDAYAARLTEIFGGEPDDDCRALRDALISYGPDDACAP